MENRKKVGERRELAAWIHLSLHLSPPYVKLPKSIGG